VVYASLSPGGESFSDALVDRFDLHGSAANSVEQAFTPTGVGGSVTALGLVLLIISGLSFTRSVQRLYEGVFRLPTLGLRNTQWALLWLAAVWAFVTVRPLILGGLSGLLEIIGTLAVSSLLWLMTPYLLLGRRVSWKRLAPVAVLSTIGMTGVGIWSVIWMPHVVATSAQQFGVIGVGFALLTWLVAAAVVLTIAAAGGAVVADRIDDLRTHA
jgi:membrane protein